MKRKIFYIIVALFGASSISSQESELVRLYKEFPDSLLQLFYYHDNETPIFSYDSRTHFLNKCYYDKSRDEYSANMFREVDGWYEGADSKPMPDTTAEDYNSYDYENNYVLKVHEDVGRISYEYNYEGQSSKLEFIVIRETDVYYIVLLEQYMPGMGILNLQEFTAYKFDLENNLIGTILLSFPKFRWENFYSKGNAKKVRKDLIGDYAVPYKVSVSDDNKKVFICLSPDLEELAWRMMYVLKISEEIGVGEAYLECYSQLGFEDLPEAKILCSPVVDFIVEGP